MRGATHKTKTLFAYLLYRGKKGAAGEEIADLLWPEAGSMEQSLNRLYHAIHCRRMALSPALSSSRESPFVIKDDQRYFLAMPEDTWVDIPVFEELCYHPGVVSVTAGSATLRAKTEIDIRSVSHGDGRWTDDRRRERSDRGVAQKSETRAAGAHVSSLCAVCYDLHASAAAAATRFAQASSTSGWAIRRRMMRGHARTTSAPIRGR